MSVRLERPVGLVLLLAVSVGGSGSQRKVAEKARSSDASTGCRVGVIEGEVASGRSFERVIGNGLRIELEAIASGWVVRVLPVQGTGKAPGGERDGDHDFAELANPPYRSVSPLLIGTDFSFRAQDALAWNPRRFRFARDRTSFEELLGVYRDEERLAQPGPAAANEAMQRQVESRLATLVSRMPEGELTILDARLVPGIGDQSRAAAMVATHLNLSAHQVDQPADGKATPLGRLGWLRFRIGFDLPKGFRAEPVVHVERGACL